jgi:hypothetical protein
MSTGTGQRYLEWSREEESRGCHSSTIPINLEDQAFTGALRKKDPEIAREPPESGAFHRRFWETRVEG